MTLHDHRHGEGGIQVRSSTSSGSSSRPTMPDPAAYAGGSKSLDEFINGPLYTSGAHVEDVDVDATRNPKRRKLIHQACRRVSGRVTADQELIDGLSNELDAAMRELQKSNVALDNCQQSKEGDLKVAGYQSRPAHRIRSSATGANRGTGESPPGNDCSLGREGENGA